MTDDDTKQCAICGNEFGAAVLLWTSQGQACPECAAKAEASPPLKLPPVPVLAALGIAAAPFFIHVSTSSSVTMNGAAVEHHSYDFVAIPAGAIGLVLGIWALAGQLRAQPRSRLNLLLAGLAIPLGLYHLLVRGLGLLG